jgi:hypothetical protein
MFWVASFFIGGLYFQARYILGLPLFSSEVFVFKSMNEVSDNTPLVVALALRA